MPGGGEAAQVKGRKFDEGVLGLLKCLGYEVIIRHEHGFDLVADPPAQQERHLRPLFAPLAKTAFEFKSGRGTSIKSAASTLKRKLTKCRRVRDSRLRALGAGVLVVEGYVSDYIRLRILKKYNIHVWDIRSILFLVSKIYMKRNLAADLGLPREELIDVSTTLLYISKAYKTAIRFLFVIFYQHPFDQLGAQRFDAIMSVITRKFNVVAKKITQPTYATVELYSLAGITDDLVDNVKKILDKKSVGRIIYDSNDFRSCSFDTAPWVFLL